MRGREGKIEKSSQTPLQVRTNYGIMLLFSFGGIGFAGASLPKGRERKTRRGAGKSRCDMADESKGKVQVHFLEKGEKAPEGAAVYDSYCDSGHGWLKVAMSELVALNVAVDITPFSYVSEDAKGRKWAYLEEDCDAGTFLRAKGGEVCLRSHHTDGHSVIRRYPSYAVTRDMVAAMPKEIVEAKVSVLEQDAHEVGFDAVRKLGDALAEDENGGRSALDCALDELDAIAYDPKRGKCLVFRYEESRRRWLLFTNTSNGRVCDNINDLKAAYAKMAA